MEEEEGGECGGAGGELANYEGALLIGILGFGCDEAEAARVGDDDPIGGEHCGEADERDGVGEVDDFGLEALTGDEGGESGDGDEEEPEGGLEEDAAPARVLPGAGHGGILGWNSCSWYRLCILLFAIAY